MTTELPETPESREESYLAAIAGQEVTTPEKPLSRKEQYLAYIAENGSGGGGTVEVVQTTGNSTKAVMSQKAVTDIIGSVETELHTVNVGTGV